MTTKIIIVSSDIPYVEYDYLDNDDVGLTIKEVAD